MTLHNRSATTAQPSSYMVILGPESQRHSHEFAEAAKSRGMLDKLLVAQAYNHFEPLESFADPYGIISCEALRQTM
ncbi:hypothetical protein [Mesorhizobium sp.]|uniref:hypothetical protein n=1 Tax=Mesorhizobium sp. TaxID=1871066 RepID=UPI000FE6DE56|nr:hypothetical protein [Mesorhizobium sp.]RWK26074.1 MAG: hypothetical protein EOR44_32035 [Mesorhizobium sp.]